MRVLHVSPSFYPAVAWGGPIHSTKAICDGLAKDPRWELSVLTTDAAGPSRRDRLADSAKTVPFPRGYNVHYARRIGGHSISVGLLWRLPLAMARADLVHLTGTYNFPTLPTLALARLLNKPVIWSPRGALQATSEWAEVPRARLKRGFERAAQVLRPRNCVLLVTSQREADTSTRRLGGIRVAVVPNSVEVPARGKSHAADRTRSQTRLMFLSRLHVKKGIEPLIAALRHLPDSFCLDVYGDGDPAYVQKLRQQAVDLGERVRFHGHVDGAAKTRAFLAADIFVLPSHSENFGIAIAEALAHAVPVITTDATPWQDLDRQGCGRCITLKTEDLAQTIALMSTADLAAMGRRGREWMLRDFCAESTDAALGRVYDTCIPRPRSERRDA
ncbi:MAG: glycosyltransferase [Rhodobacteraceae bacterium]|nr:glycosyltransferase [Paracoccaceae bacterium]